MDKMYRRQRHIYDASRKFYLLGRDEVIARVGAAPGDGVMEIACGTGRNLIKLARAYPQAEFFGLDVSKEMLATAASSIARARLSARVTLAQGDATSFSSTELFGRAKFERVLISYALSMIPGWRAAIEQALDALAPGGVVHIVDFGDCAGLPVPFAAGLRRWLAAFGVTPRNGLADALAVLSAARGLTSESQSWLQGYAVLAVAHRGDA
jgi:S-adenosylmethionine-diacylgycerolhomoserine-N-methlytransferase